MGTEGNMRIAFFGGTFDPPHRGHVALAGQVLANGWSDRVMFVPAFVPPHKQTDAITPFEHRFNMLKLAVPAEDRFLVSDIESDAALNPSYTSEILDLLELRFPRARLQLLIGEDSLRQLHTWHDAHRLVAQREMLIYPRHPEDRVSRAELLRHWSGQEADILSGGLLQMPFFDISSTDIRNSAANGNEIDKMVGAEVADYINRHGLYRGKEKH